MKIFLGLLMQMGMLNLPRLSDYWSKDPLFKTYTWKKTMSRNRFFLLLRFWHFQIPCANERLSKTAFFMNHLNETMKRIYCPSENLSFDESMVLWRGRLIFRQYIKNKKHKYGVKFYHGVIILNSMILRIVRIKWIDSSIIYLQWFTISWHSWLGSNWCDCTKANGRFFWERLQFLLITIIILSN